MDYLTAALTAVGLAMDCLAVSLSCGIVMPDFRRSDAIRLGVFFGGFQAGMTLIGWGAGETFAGRIQAVDHWIAFVLLAFIGGKMLWEGLGSEHESSNLDIRNIKVLLTLSVATSIDAMAVGISYALIEMQVLVPAIIIGLVSLAFAYAGGMFGGRLGEKFGKRMEIVGGLILIGLGIKILADHLLA